MNDDVEHWLPIAGLEGRCEVSDRGNVRSLKGRQLNPRRYETKPGGPQYWRVYIPAPVARSRYVHRLVLEAFVGPCPPGMECRHLNGDSGDNHLRNLQWGTPSENQFDKVRHGTHHYAKRTHCDEGHELDGVWLTADGTVKQRYCKRCHSAYQSGRKKAERTHCPKGHEFDGIRTHNGIPTRYCKTCTEAQLGASRGKWWSDRTHCAKGHPFDGVRKNGGRSCSTCNRERSREGKARRKGFASHADKQAAAEAKVQERIEFGHQLSEAMTRAGVNQVVAAELFGTSQANVWRWMNGRCAPSPARRGELMRLLGDVAA